MDDRTRKTYHAIEWPAACAGQKWRVRDQDKRRAVALECMALVCGPMATTSDPEWGNAETTALFTYLRHLADPDNITRSIVWDKCRADYQAFNLSRQADHWEKRGFGERGSRRLRENRFGGRKTAEGGALEDPLTREEAQQRLWKVRQRTRAREHSGTSRPPRKVTLDPEKKFNGGVPAELCPF
jgi:hypothetical protein